MKKNKNDLEYYSDYYTDDSSISLSIIKNYISNNVIFSYFQSSIIIHRMKNQIIHINQKTEK